MLSKLENLKTLGCLSCYALLLIAIVSSSCSKKSDVLKTELPERMNWTGDTVKKESDYMAFKNRRVWDNTMAYLRDRNDSLLDIWEDTYGFDSYALTVPTIPCHRSLILTSEL